MKFTNGWFIFSSTKVFAFILFLFSAVEGRMEDLAILDIQFSGKPPPGLNIDFLSRKIRETGVKYTTYRVMTKENILVIMRDKNIDISKCSDIECAVDFGRVLQADKLVVTTLTYHDNTYFLIMEMYETSSATVERSVSRDCRNCSFQQLVNVVTDAARVLFTGEEEIREEKPLKPVERPGRTGGIYIESEPSDATVFIDGKKHDETTPTLIENIEVGKRRILITKEGLRKEMDVFVHPGEITELKVELKERGTGNIRVDSSPKGADVYLDNEFVGKTPVFLKEIPAGKHKIVVKKEGYKPKKREFLLEHQKTEKIDVNMRKSRLFKVGGKVGYEVSPYWREFLGVDFKFRYYSILYGGIETGWAWYDALWDKHRGYWDANYYDTGNGDGFSLSLIPVEVRIPLWRKYIRSLSGEPIAIWANIGIFRVDVLDVPEELFGVPLEYDSTYISAPLFSAGIDIFWLSIQLISLSYLVSPNDELFYTYPFLGGGLRFNW